MSVARAGGRIITFDYLRGFFILVIIVDHLYRWPNLFAFVTGEGRLWVTAAEGFFIISGLLFGYIRGYKDRNLPMVNVLKKTLARTGQLYIWGVGISILFGWFLIHFWQPGRSLPFVPPFSFLELLYQTFSLNYAFSWIYFLKLYVLALLFAALGLYLLRAERLVLLGATSLLLWLIGFNLGLDWMTWQAMFILPAIVGYRLESIRTTVTSLQPRSRKFLEAAIFLIGGGSVIASACIVFLLPTVGAPVSSEVISAAQSVFTHESLSIPKIGLAFIWFVFFFTLFDKLQKPIRKYLHWLLYSFGTRSLTAYTTHGFVILAAQLLVPVTQNYLVNTLLAAACVITTWVLVQQRLIQRIFPQ